MKYLAAYLLLVQGGNAAPSAADIKSIVESVGGEVDESRISQLLSSMEGKTIDELVAEGAKKFASAPAGGAAASSGSASTGAAAGEAAEEKAESAAEESDDEMGFGLFD